MNPHDIFDVAQTIFLVGGLAIYVIKRLKSTEDNTEHQEELTKKIEALDNKLTSAMTRMADNVYSLAVSVGRLEGQIEVRK